MVDRRLFLPLVALCVGAYAAQDISRTHVEEAVTPVPSSVDPSTEFSPVTTAESRRMTSKPEHSTKIPKRHHEQSRFHSVEERHFDSGSDDWDYIEDQLDLSPELEDIVLQERDRHPQEDPRATMPTRPPPRPRTTAAAHHGRKSHPPVHPHPHAHPHPHTRAQQMPTRFFRLTPPYSWVEFCRKAAVEDEEPFRVSDGSFHPHFEEVPGVGVYRLHARPHSWEEARQVCEREGAQLAVPNSRAEALVLMEIHNRCPALLSTHFNDYQYVGVHDLYSEGDWETVVGDRLTETGYMVWGRNQPDNAHHHGENCLSMNRNGFFNDVPCWTELPFICEHP